MKTTLSSCQFFYESIKIRWKPTACTIIQFGPVTSDILHTGNHGITSYYTQSSCKLMHYTTYGMRHVILAVVISLLIYAWLITRHNFNQEQLDKRIRSNIAWLILLSFAIEAIFGIAVAVYVDIIPIKFLKAAATVSIKYLTKAYYNRWISYRN